MNSLSQNSVSKKIRKVLEDVRDDLSTLKWCMG